MVHTGCVRFSPSSGWMRLFLLLVFCQAFLIADVLAMEPEKKMASAEGRVSEDVGQADDKDLLQDLLVLRSNADAGDVSAQFELGRRYFKGDGLEQNDDEAIRWLRAAAEGGLARAQAGLGWMYAAGRGVKKDEKLSFVWYERAANAGFPVAQWMLGRCYELGIGVNKDRQLARDWYEKAAGQGNEKAKRRLQEWKQD